MKANKGDRSSSELCKLETGWPSKSAYGFCRLLALKQPFLLLLLLLLLLLILLLLLSLSLDCHSINSLVYTHPSIDRKVYFMRNFEGGNGDRPRFFLIDLICVDYCLGICSSYNTSQICAPVRPRKRKKMSGGEKRTISAFENN